MKHRNEKGMSVTGLLATLSIFIIIGFVAVPSLLEAGRTANTAGAMEAARSIQKAINAQGGKPSLEELANQLQIDKALSTTSKENPYRGYYFSLRYDEKDNAVITATRCRRDSGKHDFVIKDDGNLWFGKSEWKPQILTGKEDGLRCEDMHTLK